MTEKSVKTSNMPKPVPMKLFAAWEVDRTPPNCIPRLCSLTITRLSLLMALPPDLTSVSLAVKMQSSKRTLRSHEIPIPQVSTASSNAGSIATNSVLLDADLDLHFSLQYPHFLKRDGNRLLILLQRRKKYKTRTILGYKTLAEGVIRMDAVLQKSMDMTIELIMPGKGTRQGVPIATLRAERVSSIPVDQDNKNNNSVSLSDRVNEYSDEDEENEFSEDEYNDELTPYDKTPYSSKHGMRKYRKLNRGQTENDPEQDDNALGSNQLDSDSELENLKEKGSRSKISRQRNFKQKILALLKRFKVPDEMEGDVARGPTDLQDERELDKLFQELESLSCGEGDDSGPDIDSLSVNSTPKPSLKPFFCDTQNILHENLVGDPCATSGSKDYLSMSNQLNYVSSPITERGGEWRNDSSGNEGGGAANTDPEAPSSDAPNTGSPPKEKESLLERKTRLFRPSNMTPLGKKKQSFSLNADTKLIGDSCLSPTNIEPRKALLEQLSRTFASDDSIIPEVVSIMGPSQPNGQSLVSRLAPILSTTIRSLLITHNTAEVKAVLQALMNKIQKYCNTTAKPPATVKILLLGGDWLQGSVLRHYVDLLSNRPPDWVNHLRFYIVPIGSNAISRYLRNVDQSFGILFCTETWSQICERAANAVSSDSPQLKCDITEITSRINHYLNTAGPCTQIPIAEAMVNYKDEESCQIFVPFVSDVKVGCLDGPQLSVEFEDSQSTLQQQDSRSNINSGSGSSPPLGGRSSPPMPLTPAQPEPLELQIDYWPLIKVGDTKEKTSSKSQEQIKNSIKSSFRNIQVWRLPPYPQTGEISNGLTVSYATKEKKQKIMRLGKKKEREREFEREQCVDGVARLICSPKQSHPIPLRVYIDGTEWNGVKFFQLSSQWQTHVKNFPVGLIGTALVPAE